MGANQSNKKLNATSEQLNHPNTSNQFNRLVRNNKSSLASNNNAPNKQYNQLKLSSSLRNVLGKGSRLQSSSNELKKSSIRNNETKSAINNDNNNNYEKNGANINSMNNFNTNQDCDDESFGFKPSMKCKSSLNHQLNQRSVDSSPYNHNHNNSNIIISNNNNNNINNDNNNINLDSSYYVTNSLRKVNINSKTRGNNYVGAPSVSQHRQLQQLTPNSNLDTIDRNCNYIELNNTNTIHNGTSLVPANSTQQNNHHLKHHMNCHLKHYYYVDPTNDLTMSSEPKNENPSPITKGTSKMAKGDGSISGPTMVAYHDVELSEKENSRLRVSSDVNSNDTLAILNSPILNHSNRMVSNNGTQVNINLSANTTSNNNNNNSNSNSNNSNNDIYESSITSTNDRQKASRSTMKEQQVDVKSELLLHHYQPNSDIATASANNHNSKSLLNASHDGTDKPRNRAQRAQSKQPLGEVNNINNNGYNQTHARYTQLTRLASCANDPYQFSYQQTLIHDPYRQHQQQQQAQFQQQIQHQSPRLVADYYYQTYNMNPINQYGQFHDPNSERNYQTQPTRNNSMHHQMSPCYGYQPQMLDFHQASARNVNRNGVNNYQRLNDMQLYANNNTLQSASKEGKASRSRLNLFGGSQTLDTRSKKSNPLASLFGMSHNSNTIHSTKRGKSPARGAAMPTSSLSQRSAPSSLKRIKSSPLTAQQASYEAMRTIDMYLMRQIAKSCMDPVMEQKIELEIRLRELAAQAMLEARDEIDILEVEKSLLTSDQRFSCYAIQLEQRRKELSNRSLSTDSGRGSSKSGRDGCFSRNQHHVKQNKLRSDVIGPPGADATSSPTFSSNSQSPSKLSPVSGQSTDLPSLNTNDSSSNSSRNGGGGEGARGLSRNYSRTGAFRRSNNTTNSHKIKAKQSNNGGSKEQATSKITPESGPIDCNIVIGNRVSLSVSEIRVPLMWRDVDHFKGRGDYKRFAVFCLLKIDSQIYDTQLMTDIDRDVTDITFDDVIVFNDVDRNFELKLEIYSCIYLEEFSLSSAPRKLKEKLTNSVSRAMGRRLVSQTASSNYTKELEAYDKSYRFSQIAEASLKLEDASNSVKTYDLTLAGSGVLCSKSTLLSDTVSRRSHQSPFSYYLYQSNGATNSNAGSDQSNASFNSNHSKDANKNILPLFGHFCCKLLVKPDTTLNNWDLITASNQLSNTMAQ